MLKIPDESVGPADEKVSPPEAVVEVGDIKDPLEKVGLQMDPAKRTPYTFQLCHLSLLSSFSPASLVFPTLQRDFPLKICK